MNANLTAHRPTFVTHLECSLTGERYEADTPWPVAREGGAADTTMPRDLTCSGRSSKLGR